MASTKIKLKNRPTKTGECPLFLLIFHNNSKAEFSLQIKVLPEHWDDSKSTVKRKHPRAGMLNSIVARRVTFFTDIIAKLELEDSNYSIKDLKKVVSSERNETKVDSTKVIDTLQHYIKQNPENLQFNSLYSYTSLIACLTTYDRNVRYSDLSADYCYRYEKYLQKEGKAVNTISTRMKILRKAVTIAIKQGTLQSNPLTGYKRTNEESKREYLTVIELKALEQHKCTSTGKQKILDLFLFLCYTGLRYSDLCTLTLNDIRLENDAYRLYFRMDKGNETLSMKLSAKALSIYNKHFKKKSRYGFEILDESKDLSTEELLKNEISRRNAYFNKSIKQTAKAVELNKNVSMHIGRHTFATISLSLGVPIEVVSKLLGHKNIKETQIYAKILDKSKDKAIDLWDRI